MCARKTLMAALVLAGLSDTTQAALLDRGGGLIYDDELNVTWLQDVNYGAGSIYDSMDGTTDGRMRWWNAAPWAANLSYYDSVRNVTYEDWRLPTTGPVNGATLTYSGSYDGSTDTAWNVSAPGSAYAGTKASEMAYLFYNELGNNSYCQVSTIFACSPAQTDWGLVNTGPFINFQGGAYWSGTQPPEAWGTDAAWFFVFGSDSQAGIWDSDVGAQWIFSRDSRIHVLAVRDGDVAAIPEPETWALMLSGLALVGVIARRRKQAITEARPR